MNSSFKNEENLKTKVPATNQYKHYSCKKGFVQCKQDLYCVSRRFVCDGIYDCHDKSDEESCENTYFQKYSCDKNSTKIPYFLICDGINDCQDKSDEENCGELKD